MDRKARFSRASNFALYYGYDRASELANYDIAVLEPAGQTVDSLEEIKLSGTLAIAYISVMEIPVWSKELSLLKTEDFLQFEGKPYKNPQYGNYWLDLTSQNWTEILLQRAHDLLDGAGYDGLFLDTIGYVESLQLSSDARRELLPAASDIVRKLRKQFPSCLLIQNCGLEQLYQFTAQYIDGICWENPPFNQTKSSEWVARVISNLEHVKKTFGLQIFLLVEESHLNSQEFSLVKKVAQDKNFLKYYAPSCYTSGVFHQDL